MGVATVALGVSLWLRVRHGLEIVPSARFAWASLLDALAFYAAALVGALLGFRRPRNPIGWLLLVMGSAYMLQDTAAAYASVAYADPAQLPVGSLALHADWLSAWLWTSFVVVFPLLLLLFPDGRPPTPRWRWLVWATCATGAALVLVTTTSMWLARSPTRRLAEHTEEGAWLVVFAVLLATLFAAGAAAGVSLIVRYRRAATVERQQLRWVAAAGSALVLALLVGGIGDVTGQRTLSLVGELGGLVALVAVPVSIAVAVLRYRLYDIDRVVSRTVTYTLLTAVLAGVYFAAVLALSGLLSPLAAGSEVAVAAATLAAAAVFAPARRRIQTAVDRRFNRARYDAARVLVAFRGRLRDEVGLDDVVAATCDAVTRTVQPQQLSLWTLDRTTDGPAPRGPRR